MLTLVLVFVLALGARSTRRPGRDRIVSGAAAGAGASLRTARSGPDDGDRRGNGQYRPSGRLVATDPLGTCIRLRDAGRPGRSPRRAHPADDLPEDRRWTLEAGSSS